MEASEDNVVRQSQVVKPPTKTKGPPTPNKCTTPPPTVSPQESISNGLLSYINDEIDENAREHAKRFHVAMQVARCPAPNFSMLDLCEQWAVLKKHSLLEPILNKISGL